MAVITVLGAGAMGSALTRPLVEAGWQVRLWGSIYDDAILDAIEAGQVHPTLKETISPAVTTFRAGQLAQAVNQAQVVVISVASGAVVSVLEQVGPYLDGVESLWLTSKGFWQTETEVELLPEAIKQSAKPTATVFACRDYELAKRYAKTVTTPNYSVTPSQDEIGVEVCAALKNIYAIALGIADGMSAADEQPRDNLRAAIFVQAVAEMASLCHALGGDLQTAYGLAGMGDLQLTSTAGRSRLYGHAVGAGQNPRQALEQMQSQGLTIEGSPAALIAHQLVQQLGINAPLLEAVYQMLHGHVDDARALICAVALGTEA